MSAEQAVSGGGTSCEGNHSPSQATLEPRAISLRAPSPAPLSALLVTARGLDARADLLKQLLGIVAHHPAADAKDRHRQVGEAEQEHREQGDTGG